jgi:NADH:ubiquinone oxidoreductase subunit 2 (subunit N)
MSGMIVSGLVMVIATLMALARFDLRKCLGYSAAIDVGFTVLMFAMFSGTFSGIIASSFAGVFMTMLLYILRASIGCKKLRIVRPGYLPRIRWVYYGPENFRGKWSAA